MYSVVAAPPRVSSVQIPSAPAQLFQLLLSARLVTAYPEDKMRVLLLLLLPRCGWCLDLDCREVGGSITQIDAGSAQVSGVNAGGGIFLLSGGSWTSLPGGLSHITVGPVGVWGVNRNYMVYKWNGANFDQQEGALKQIDAGGATYISGINPNNAVFCLSNPTTASRTWHLIEGAMKYYTCGPLGCWGVNSTDDIHFRLGVTPSFCQGTGWQQVAGKLSMIEVGTDGSVYGVTHEGGVYRRDGITDRNPLGTKWTQLYYRCYKFSHVSYDLSQVWLLTTDGKTLQCEV